MINLLLRLYPAVWRARYGDEFAVVLEERSLGPFDVADVLLGAIDAHLHLRGLGAASQHAKGFAMSLRIGGYAAIVGGVLWLLALAGNAINNGGESPPPWLGLAIVGATVMTLVALIGLSAFQARSHPRLTWAAFAIPAAGAVVSLVGFATLVRTGGSDTLLVVGITAYLLSLIGIVTMMLGSILFAVATWRTRALSRSGSALLAVGPLLAVLAVLGLGVALPSPIVMVPIVAAILVFPAGWVLIGISALRITGPAAAPAAGGS